MIILMACLLGLLIRSQSSKLDEGYHPEYHQDMTKYCSRIGNCKPGSHVACMYNSGPYSVMGPKCDKNSKPIQFSEALQASILSAVNGCYAYPVLRYRRDYMYQWDHELADLAQLWANQCDDGHDKCRSTVKFSNVSQDIYSTLYPYPKWHNDDIVGPKAYQFSSENVKNVLIATFNNWHNQKSTVTRKMIMDAKPDNTYMRMVNGRNTHMGCGMAIYTSYSVQENGYLPKNNVAKIVCNWSTDLLINKSVYNTDPPHGESSVACGCQSDQMEGYGCLCVNKPQSKGAFVSRRADEAAEWKTGEDENMDVLCKRPTFVVMPLFAFEDGDETLLNMTGIPQKTSPQVLRFDEQALQQKMIPLLSGNPMMFKKLLGPGIIRSIPNVRSLSSGEKMSHLRVGLNTMHKNNRQPISAIAPAGSIYTVQQSPESQAVSNGPPLDVGGPYGYDLEGSSTYNSPTIGIQSRPQHEPKITNEQLFREYQEFVDPRNIDETDYKHLLSLVLEELLDDNNNVNDYLNSQEKLDFSNIGRSKKPARQSYLISNLERYEEQDKNKAKMFSNVGYIRPSSEEYIWPVIRKQNPLKHGHYDTKKINSNKNRYGFENEKTIRNIRRDFRSNLNAGAMQLNQGANDDLYSDINRYSNDVQGYA